MSAHNSGPAPSGHGPVAMSGQKMRPQPRPAGNDRPAQQPQTGSRPGPYQAGPVGAGKGIASGLAEDATPAGVGAI